MQFTRKARKSLQSLCQVWLAPAAAVSDTIAVMASGQAEPISSQKEAFIKYHQDFLAVRSSSPGLLCCKGIIPLLFFMVQAGFATPSPSSFPYCGNESCCGTSGAAPSDPYQLVSTDICTQQQFTGR